MERGVPEKCLLRHHSTACLINNALPVQLGNRNPSFWACLYQNLSRIYQTLHCCTVKCRDCGGAKIVQTLLSLSGFMFVLECLQFSSGPHFVFIRANMKHPLWPQVSLWVCSNLGSDKLLSSLSWRWGCLNLARNKVIHESF